MRGPSKSQNYNLTQAQVSRFVEAFADGVGVARAALAAGINPRIALSAGMQLLSTVGICEKIHAHMNEGPARDKFAQEWMHPIDVEEDEIPLFDRIQMAREALAYASRGNLPPPSIIEFVPRPLSRRAARARAARAVQEII